MPLWPAESAAAPRWPYLPARSARSAGDSARRSTCRPDRLRCATWWDLGGIGRREIHQHALMLSTGQLESQDTNRSQRAPFRWWSYQKPPERVRSYQAGGWGVANDTIQ